MSSNTSVMAAVKACCACGTDLNGQPRMKDSHKRYWCVPCGEADQRKKAMSGTHMACVGCRKPFPKAQLHKHGEYFFCKPCLKQRTTAGAGAHESTHPPTISHSPSAAAAASAQGSDRRRIIMLAAVLVVLGLFALLYNFVLLA